MLLVELKFDTFDGPYSVFKMDVALKKNIIWMEKLLPRTGQRFKEPPDISHHIEKRYIVYQIIDFRQFERLV